MPGMLAKHKIPLLFMRYYLFALILPLVLSFFFYRLTISSMEKNICETQLLTLAQGGDRVIMNLYNLQQLVHQIGASMEIRKYGILANPLEDPSGLSAYRETFKFLQVIKTTNTLFDGILFYAPKSRTMLWQDGALIRMDNGYGGVFQIHGRDDNETEEFLGARYPYSYLYGFDLVLLGKAYQSPLVLACSIPTIEDQFVNLFLFLSREKFLEPFSVNTEAGEWIYVSGGAGAYFSTHDAPGESYIAGIAGKMTAGAGFFTDRIENENVLITYMRDDRNGFYYISGVPRRRVLDMTRGMRFIVTILLALSTIGGIGIALFMAISSSRPIESLYHIITGNLEPGEMPVFSYDFLNSRVADAFAGKRRLESEVNRLIPAQKQSLVYRLLNPGAGETGDIQKEFNDLGIDLRGGPFCVLIVAINDMDTSYGFNEISAYKVLIDKIMTKTVTENGYAYIGVFHNEVDKETIIIKSVRESAETLIGEMEGIAGSVTRKLMAQNNISITLAGCIADRAGEISRAYYRACAALGYESKSENTRILWFDARFFPPAPANSAEEADTANNNTNNDERIERIARYIDMHFTDPQISLASVASEFAITEFYLSHLFKEKTGVNFSKYLEKLRMKYAQILLSEKQYKVADAAREAGYGSHQAFGRAYRKYYGKSPSAYNNRL